MDRNYNRQEVLRILIAAGARASFADCALLLETPPESVSQALAYSDRFAPRINNDHEQDGN